MEVKGKRIGIIGLGMRTGVVSAKVLVELGAQVIVSDVKPAEKLKNELALLAGISEISYDLGGHTDQVLDVDLLVVSPGVPINIPILTKARQLGIQMISEVELSYRLAKASFIAITGTNGKSTTTALLGQLLHTYPEEVFVGGNIGRPLIGRVLELKASDLIVAELSSFQLETIERFRPHIALFLNFTADHLDRHQTMEAYLEAKMNIFINQRNDDFIILNADDQRVSQLASQVPSKVIWFSRQKKLVPGCYLDRDQMICDLGQGPRELISTDELKIRGTHNIENALAASAAAALAGISLQNIRNGLRDFRGLEHTLEYVTTHKESKYYNDSKGTNPVASIKALEAFSEPIVLITGGLDRNLDFTDFIHIILKKVKTLILIGQTQEIIKDKAVEAGFSGQIRESDSLEEAVSVAANSSQPGDVVLLSPASASWDMFANYQQRGRLFKKYVHELAN